MTFEQDTLERISKMRTKQNRLSEYFPVKQTLSKIISSPSTAKEKHFVMFINIILLVPCVLLLFWAW